MVRKKTWKKWNFYCNWSIFFAVLRLLQKRAQLYLLWTFNEFGMAIVHWPFPIFREQSQNCWITVVITESKLFISLEVTTSIEVRGFAGWEKLQVKNSSRRILKHQKRLYVQFRLCVIVWFGSSTDYSQKHLILELKDVPKHFRSLRWAATPLHTHFTSNINPSAST